MDNSTSSESLSIGVSLDTRDILNLVEEVLNLRNPLMLYKITSINSSLQMFLYTLFSSQRSVILCHVYRSLIDP